MPIRQGLNKKSRENAKFSVIEQTNIAFEQFLVLGFVQKL